MAAGLFAAAAAFSGFALAGGLVAVTVAPVAFALAYALLARVDGAQLFPLASFDVEPIAPRHAPDDTQDERVVRLFDPRQLTIARPGPVRPAGTRHDAGQALSDALAQLKHSLR